MQRQHIFWHILQFSSKVWVVLCPAGAQLWMTITAVVGYGTLLLAALQFHIPFSDVLLSIEIYFLVITIVLPVSYLPESFIQQVSFLVSSYPFKFINDHACICLYTNSCMQHNHSILPLIFFTKCLKSNQKAVGQIVSKLLVNNINDVLSSFSILS